MSKDQNVAALGRTAEIMAAHEFERLGEFFAQNVVDHDPADGQAPGLDGIIRYWRDFAEAFPDFEFVPEVVVVDDDYVTLVFRASGTHRGEFMGHPATGKRFEVRSIQVSRHENGAGVERWGCTDVQGTLRQLSLTSDS
jgi:steroid delta-isomerase-like uncharacterized protein